MISPLCNPNITSLQTGAIRRKLRVSHHYQALLAEAEQHRKWLWKKPLLSANGEALSAIHHITSSAFLWPEIAHTGPNWYAVYTRPNHEKQVARHFDAREIEFYLPLYHATHCWKNRCKVDLQLPLFPNYVFVRISSGQQCRVLEISGVISIVNNGHDPLPLDPSEIETLRAGLHLRRAEPHPYLTVGDRARIRCGPLAGLEGIVLRNGNGWRVVVCLEQIMNGVAVEVDSYELEPLAPRPWHNSSPSSLSTDR